MGTDILKPSVTIPVPIKARFGIAATKLEWLAKNIELLILQTLLIDYMHIHLREWDVDAFFVECVVDFQIHLEEH